MRRMFSTFFLKNLKRQIEGRGKLEKKKKFSAGELPVFEVNPAAAPLLI